MSATNTPQERIPEANDFPKDIILSLVPSQDKKPPSNILILLHGLGDRHEPFATLGSRFNFPETLCISLRGPSQLPFSETGFHWGDDLIFDSSTGGLDMDTGFERTVKMLETVIDEVLIGKCGWSRRAIIFFGFGQGGMVALNTAARLSSSNADGEFGGVISIGGPLPHSAPSPHPKAKTPVIVLGGSKNTAITDTAESRIRNVFGAATIVHWSGKSGDGMMQNAEETRPMMEFIARRLRSKAGIPKGAVELR
ncbi:phospholipase/Carboxylesteras-like protein [Ascodesmis nigricans]|uniref:Phospholipase/Carboxylesteras-like protein n=1 Tax=Ascodesmis nigricans TaxID=341454 RepID=A0A4S2N140_9PEZI|nr:phospholipase/Carboxylesteras-like protein [Ascodesmis nigricans]